jgi:hypothetical protein
VKCLQPNLFSFFGNLLNRVVLGTYFNMNLYNLIQMEDEKEHCEKELEGTKGLLLETLDEKKRLEVETDQLKSLLKREVAQFDSELVRIYLFVTKT